MKHLLRPIVAASLAVFCLVFAAVSYAVTGDPIPFMGDSGHTVAVTGPGDYTPAETTADEPTETATTAPAEETVKPPPTTTTKAPPAKTTPQPAPAAPPPVTQFEFAVQEEASLVFNNNPAMAEAAAGLITGLPATWVRMIMYPDKLFHPKKNTYIGYARYQAAIEMLAQKGVSVQIVIGCNRQKWTPERYADFTSKVVQHFSSRVNRYSICNEPNLGSWLEAFKGHTKPDTYCLMYKAGYKAVKDALPSAQVLIGELSSGDDPKLAYDGPLEFMRELLRPGGQCSQLVADGFAHHPYQQNNPPSEETPSNGVGIGSLDRLNQLLDEAFANGSLKTPQGTRLDIYLTEFGWQSRATDRLAYRNLPDDVRAAYWTEALNIACNTPHIVQILAYELVSSPGAWNTSIATLELQPDGTWLAKTDQAYTAIQNWIKASPQCIKR